MTLGDEEVRYGGKKENQLVRRLKQASKDPQNLNCRWLLEDAASEIVPWRAIAILSAGANVWWMWRYW